MSSPSAEVVVTAVVEDKEPENEGYISPVFKLLVVAILLGSGLFVALLLGGVFDTSSGVESCVCVNPSTDAICGCVVPVSNGSYIPFLQNLCKPLDGVCLEASAINGSLLSELEFNQSSLVSNCTFACDIE
mmetsp:Transcript_2648/g.2995  ORF Transcript_2648/g.2995 Transcript_2648/m.2995 type:complete len:131 (+) Transcript_2648:211-603(+)|eukprot:CAMPEP_0184040980 /NCGR_PEP_ID=MMETSP0955-20130417/60386_1 /TAXON_ID=627963 /ORGANISM="Aplanochytrium sp, Strain PBS07" /LENGTH=130 /DNA_ID=CAMNT_0026331043 /DNA_START=87 /DNA_END=479 /DNA_ORIENTATION=+